MKVFAFVLITLLCVGCDKDSQVLRNLENSKWKVISNKSTKYLGGNVDNESTGENIGYFEFEKDGKCNIVMNATLSSSQQTNEVVSTNLSNGKYEVFGSNDKNYDAKMNIEFDKQNFFTYSIKQESKRKMSLTDRSKMQSYYGDGYVVEITIEKE